ncbi:MAG: RNA polymerase sigma factor [Myxococcales bacterium]|nr:RNA polymerase sigma factor [Myxococcales bacterium]MCB9549917.1 RNA polymerase sigma factor [Myxococcales bacterium]
MDCYARGDADGFERLYEIVADELWAFIYARLRHQASAEDVMQQTLLHMHHARGRFRAGANVHPWMFTIAWRLIIDRRRRCRDALDVDCLDLIDGRAQPDDQVSAIELGGRLETAYGELPERQRVALELVRVAGLSHKETAEALGTTEAAVKSLLHRALAALRDSTMEEA